MWYGWLWLIVGDLTSIWMVIECPICHYVESVYNYWWCNWIKNYLPRAMCSLFIWNCKKKSYTRVVTHSLPLKCVMSVVNYNVTEEVSMHIVRMHPKCRLPKPYDQTHAVYTFVSRPLRDLNVDCHDSNQLGIFLKWMHAWGSVTLVTWGAAN